MSKKKAFSGSTMTLKDFHGGSIPTDIPLPSAPGVIVRPSDRSGYDRPQWGRSDHRSRPNSSPASRHFDDRAPFLTHTVHIGRNFDEDERKPLDGVSAPRRTVIDESIRGTSSRVELNPEPVSSARVLGRQVLGSAAPGNSYLGRVVEGSHAGVSAPHLGGNSGQGVPGSSPNAWAARREAALGIIEPHQSTWTAQNAASKLAHASALEKVSSGRWQTKQSSQYHTDIEVINHDDQGNGVQAKTYEDGAYNRLDLIEGREYYDAKLVRHFERSFNIEDGGRGVRKEVMDQERAGALLHLEVRERKAQIYNGVLQLAYPDGKHAVPELQAPAHLEPLERPKLRLLPRTKPLESMEPPVADHKRGSQHVGIPAAKCGNDFGNMNTAKPGVAGTESGNQALERPKLNLKPRSQPVEQLEENTERGRNTLFGGARPRELVLKERGVDEIAIIHSDMGQQADRVKHDASKGERVTGNGASARQSDKIEHHPLDQRMVKKYDKRDHRGDSERVDMQRRSWRNENRRNSKEPEMQQQQQQQQQQQSSPESWRKPVEEPKPASDIGGMRYGKAASAVDLAQAFARSISDPKTTDRYSGQKPIPSRTQVPFSRLTSPVSRPQINGY